MEAIFGFFGSAFVWWLMILCVTSLFGKGKSFIGGTGNVIGYCGRSCGKALPTLFKLIGNLLRFLFHGIMGFLRGLWNLISGR